MRKTKRNKKKVCAEIQKLIANLEGNWGLCAVGKERLRWWKRNGHRFKSINEALRGWTPKQVSAFASYACPSYKWDDLSRIEDILDRIQSSPAKVIDGMVKEGLISKKLVKMARDEVSNEAATKILSMLGRVHW